MSKINAISQSMSDAAATLQTTLNKTTVIVLSLNEEGHMQIGWAGNKTVNLMGLLSWGAAALSEHIINEDE